MYISLWMSVSMAVCFCVWVFGSVLVFPLCVVGILYVPICVHTHLSLGVWVYESGLVCV